MAKIHIESLKEQALRLIESLSADLQVESLEITQATKEIGRSAYGDQPADQAEIVAMMAINGHRMTQLRELTWLVERIKRKDPTIGVCQYTSSEDAEEICGDLINPRRMMLVPTTTFCVACARTLEAEQKIRRRA